MRHYRHASVALVTMFSVLVAPISSAHFGGTSNPPIRGTVVLDSIQLVPGGVLDGDDGLDFDAEVMVLVNIGQQPAHMTAFLFSTTDLDFDFDVGNNWIIGGPIYQHDECSPLSSAGGEVKVIELDTEGEDFAYVALSLGIAGLITAWKSPPFVVALPVAIFSLGLTIYSFEEDTDYGMAPFALPASPGSSTIAVTGPDGGAFVDFTVAVQNLATPDCGSPPAENACLVPSDRDTQIQAFDDFQQALALADAVDVEPGNPAGLTPQDVADIRSALRQSTVDVVDVLVDTIVTESKRDYPQAHNQAKTLLAQARALSATDQEGAIDLYEMAALTVQDEVIDVCSNPPPVVSAVPTLNQWGIIVSCVLLMLTLAWVRRYRVARRSE